LSLSRSARIWLASVLLSAIAVPSALPADAQTTPVSVTTTTPFKLSELPQPPIDSKQNFVDYMVKTRHEDPKMLAWRFDRAQAMIENKDIWREKELRAYLLTPREDFVLDRNRSRAYDHAFLDIGYGVTISGPIWSGA
jgi:Protein-L-isoaspartate carboxylmethyltransferase